MLKQELKNMAILSGKIAGGVVFAFIYLTILVAIVAGVTKLSETIAVVLGIALFVFHFSMIVMFLTRGIEIISEGRRERNRGFYDW